ncbi:MAG TPA: hypothetical protein VLA96_12205 [Terriglobales bacterium]|jgi:hypothetical protein|nr:hypothetical protein [Terriglobales bacterium]
MRRTCASLLLLLVLGVIFAPLAHASYGRSAHACCLKKTHGKTAISQAASHGQSRHACCTLATLDTATPAAPRPATRPQLAHPVIEEFYPAEDSAEPLALESDRAPPAASSDR